MFVDSEYRISTIPCFSIVPHSSVEIHRQIPSLEYINLDVFIIIMSRVTFEQLPKETIDPINLDVLNLYSTSWIDVSLGCIIVFTIYKIIKRLK